MTTDKNIVKLCLLSIFLCHVNLAFSQIGFQDYEFDSTKTYKITCINGSFIVGTFEEKKEDLCFFKTIDSSILSCPVSEIAAIKVLEESSIPKPKIWAPYPHASNYFLGPSAIPQGKKSAYYKYSLYTYHMANFGITDHFSVMIGSNNFSFGTEPSHILIFPNSGFKLHEYVHAGIGYLFINRPRESISLGYEINWKLFYGMVTLGSSENNITLGLGYDRRSPPTEDILQKPFISLSGMVRVSNKVALISENWIITSQSGDYIGQFSAGFRYFKEKVSLDFFLFTNGEIGGYIGALPIINFNYKFW